MLSTTLFPSSAPSMHVVVAGRTLYLFVVGSAPVPAYAAFSAFTGFDRDGPATTALDTPPMNRPAPWLELDEGAGAADRDDMAAAGGLRWSAEASARDAETWCEVSARCATDGCSQSPASRRLGCCVHCRDSVELEPSRAALP
jgi:hypothetical protein